MYTDKEIAEGGTILRSLVGSRVHGISVGSDDRDELGIAVPPKGSVIGLDKFENWVYRTQPEGARSGPGDLDLTIYSLRKWTHLAAAKGNPSILLLLFVPDDALVLDTRQGRYLRTLAPLFVTRQAARGFYGYFGAQKRALTGEGGGYRSNRPELIEQYGFDTKFGGHLIRLGYQGLEFLTEGRMSLPMREGERSTVVAVRTGGYTLPQVVEMANDLESRLKIFLDDPNLPNDPDWDTINRELVHIHEWCWCDPAFRW